MENMLSELDKAKAEFGILAKQLQEKERLVKNHLHSFSTGEDSSRDEEGQRLERERDSIYQLTREAQERLFKLQKK